MTGTDRDLSGIEPELAAFVPHLPDLALGDVAAARAAGVELVRCAAAAAGPPDPSGLTTSEITIPVPGGPPLLVSLYEPSDPPVEGTARPAVVVVHGGGFVMGDRASMDKECMKLARTLGVLVANPEYRLAPEHAAPAAVDDVHALLVALAARDDVDASRMAVVGSSAGAAIAAGAALAIRERGAARRSCCRCWTTLPWTTGSPVSPPSGSPRRRCGTAARASRCGTTTSAPTAATACHPLRRRHERVTWRDCRRRPDDRAVRPAAGGGLEYARRLIEAGVPVELHNVPGVFHGFTTLPSDTSRRVLGWRTGALAHAPGVEVPGSTSRHRVNK